jgi:hypothetical protein
MAICLVGVFLRCQTIEIRPIGLELIDFLFSLNRKPNFLT